jgi:hypothetical protein
MALQIVKADQRMAQAKEKNSLLVLGQYNVGKTSLLYTLPPETTLALDFEGGFKSVETWTGDSITLRTFEEAQDIACLIGGADPAAGPREPYCQDHYNQVAAEYKGFNIEKYKYVFFDSISEMTARAMLKAKNENWVVKKGTNEIVQDGLGAYGDMASDVLTLVRHMQHSAGRTIIFVGRLEDVVDDNKRHIWQPQLEGGKIKRELPGIVDQVITMGFFDYAENIGWTHAPDGKGEHRAFCCRRQNPFGLPAKERTIGRLDMIEEPHLGNLLEKINAPATEAAVAALKHGHAGIKDAK